MDRTKPSIRKYIVTIVVSSTIGMVLCAIILSFIGSKVGFGSQAVLVVVLTSFPVIQFSSLYGFYKGLTKYYGLTIT